MMLRQVMSGKKKLCLGVVDRSRWILMGFMCVLGCWWCSEFDFVLSGFEIWSDWCGDELMIGQGRNCA
jgi:hypothetical protein